jgi:dUTP pyrophosphatase
MNAACHDPATDRVRARATQPQEGPERGGDVAHAGYAVGVSEYSGARAAVDVLLQLLDPDLPAPSYAHPGDAGADLVTRVDVTVEPLGRCTVPTGVAIALPDGYAAFVHPRSGLAARSGLTIVNAPGTVDAGYRGEIQVTLLNTDASIPVVLRRGDRIAQLVVQRVSRARFVEVERLPGSVRGSGGFGSTGGFSRADEEMAQ